MPHKPSFKQKLFLIMFGLFLFLSIIEIGLRIGGFILLSLQEQRNNVSIRENGEYRILCLGESTTARGGEDSWPFQLKEVLNGRSTKFFFKVINKGIEGVQSPEILLKLEKNINQYKPNMVITLMGVNDEAGTLRYDDSLAVKVKLFFSNFRVYKLMKLIYSRIQNTIKNNLIKTAAVVSAKNIEEIKEMYFEGKCKESMDILREMIRANPGDESLYSGLAHAYLMQEKYSEAEEMFKKAIEIKPNSDSLYLDLGSCYIKARRYDEAEEVFKKTIQINPLNAGAYIELGYYYTGIGEFEQAEGMFKKAIEVNPKYEPAYTELGGYYRAKGNFKKIQELADKIVKEGIENDRLYAFVGIFYKGQGKDEEAERYFKKANEFRLNYYNPATRYNYQRLKEVLTQREIKLICVQYPMRSTEPLKKLFDSTEGMIFVDNERIFKEAVASAKYEDYFMDNFGGDFGHCTHKGNRLLAENIANAISKEIFNK